MRIFQPDHYLTFNGDFCSLNTVVDYEKLVPGLKLTLDSSFKPDTGAKVGHLTLGPFCIISHIWSLFWRFLSPAAFQSGKLKADYKHEKLVFGTDMNLSRYIWNTIYGKLHSLFIIWKLPVNDHYQIQLAPGQHLCICRSRCLCSWLPDRLRCRYSDCAKFKLF